MIQQFHHNINEFLLQSKRFKFIRKKKYLNINNNLDDELRNEIDDEERKDELYIESKSKSDKVNLKIEIEYDKREKI